MYWHDIKHCGLDKMRRKEHATTMLYCHSFSVYLKFQFKEAPAHAWRKRLKLLKWTEFLKRERWQKEMLKLPKWNRKNAPKITQTMNALKNLQSNLSMKINYFKYTWTSVNETMNNFWIINNCLRFYWFSSQSNLHHPQGIKNLLTLCIEENPQI